MNLSIDTEEKSNKKSVFAPSNFEHFKATINVYQFFEKTIPGIWEYKICDYDPLTNFLKELRYVGFYGDHLGNRHGFNISFHQGRAEFEKELGDVIGMIERNGYCQRKGHHPLLPLPPEDSHRKKSYELGRKFPKSVDPFKCITAHKDHVEIICGTQKHIIPYNLTDEEWEKRTGWKT